MSTSIGIVGGGVGGMVAALLLHKQNCKVTIYEKNSMLGGRLAYHERDGVRIDRGPTIVLLPEMIFSILEMAGIERSRLDLRMCEPLARIHFADGSSFTKYHDRDKQIAEIERLFPGESNGYLRYMADLKRIFDEAKPVFLERFFPSKSSLLSWRNVKTLWSAQAHTSVQRLARKYFKDERLRHAYSLQTLYIGGSPHGTPGLYSLIPYAEQDFGVWYLKGGYWGLADLLSAELKSRGIDIQLSTEVEQLWMEKQNCRGVVIGGRKHAHDLVVYNGDFPLLQTLIAEDEDVKQKTVHMTPSSGCVLVYLKANRTWEQLTTHQFFLPEHFEEQMRSVFNQKKIPKTPSYYVFHPQTMDRDVAPEGQSLLYILIPVPSSPAIAWHEVAPALVEQVLDNLQGRALTGLRDAIEWCDIRTPADAEKSGLYGGGSFGLAPTWLQSGMFRPQIKVKDTHNLYAVGASIHPGGGIPIVMQGAKLLAQHLSKELGI